MKNLTKLSVFLHHASIIFIICLVFYPVNKVKAQFAKGADVSWMSEMEASGFKWYDDNGNQKDLLQILKEHGMNAIRLRLWVDPDGGWCDLNDMLYKAKRAKNAGMDIMLTIHYSDSWADPGQQNKPASWSGLSIQELYTKVYRYTYNVISTMKANNVTPKWVQIGNETNDGMLWEDGRASSNMQTYAWLVNSGHNAVKAVSSSIITVVHLANGDQNTLYRWNIGGLIDNGANFDAIGMSLYPLPENWQDLTNKCKNNMSDMKSRFGKQVIICEVGMRQDYPETTKAFLEDIISKTQSVGGLGVFYWEPQVYNGWKGYGKGVWQENGRPSVALDAFGGVSSSASTIKVRVRGTAGSEHIKLLVNGNMVDEWTLSTSYKTYTATTSSTGDINIEFDNDGSGLDVQVDYITVNGSTRQAEDQSYNTGVWQDGSCGGSYSEWMHCNGIIGFGDVTLKGALTDLNKVETFDFNLFPNPVTDGILTIALPELEGESVIRIINLSGKVIKEVHNINQQTINIELDVNPGMYFVQIINNESTSVKKVAVK